MTCWKSLFFGIDPDPDVDLRSVFPFLNIGRWPFYTIYDQSPQHNTSVVLTEFALSECSSYYLFSWLFCLGIVLA